MERSEPLKLVQTLDSAVGRPYPLIVGILNVTPDSFTDDGVADSDQALTRAQELLDGGAAILDIGAESTRPGARPVSAQEELRRLRQVVPAVVQRAFVSIDTYKAEVAEEMLSLGAKMINDVSALRADPRLAEVLAAHKAFIVLMYSKEQDSRPHATFAEMHYADVTAEIAEFLLRRIEFAVQAGIEPNRIIVDPGMGRFISHDPSYSLRVIEELRRFKEFGIEAPLMIGVSRKGFVPQGAERDYQSQLLAKQAVKNGARLVRTHNTAQARRMILDDLPG